MPLSSQGEDVLPAYGSFMPPWLFSPPCQLMDNRVSPIIHRPVLDFQLHGCTVASVCWVWGEGAECPNSGPCVFISSWTPAPPSHQSSFSISAIKDQSSSYRLVDFLDTIRKLVFWLFCWFFPGKLSFSFLQAGHSGTVCSTRHPQALATLFCRFSPWGNIFRPYRFNFGIMMAWLSET